MLPGVYLATKKDGTLYYRSNITFRGKHISLGSYESEEKAGAIYEIANHILTDSRILFTDYPAYSTSFPFEKWVTLFNFRDHNIYVRNPIYLRNGYFSYYLNESEELKFDIDDLFYYSSHKIIRRQGHLFVNDYGMQVSVLSRYGIRNYAVAGRDYDFVNGDSSDFRYANIKIHNPFHGVMKIEKNGLTKYKTYIHINGNYKVGIYTSEAKAAVAYNKAADLAKSFGITKNFPENYVDELTPKQYAELYTKIKISTKYISYLQQNQNMCSLS